jgi:carboxyl-terminal processing protease
MTSHARVAVLAAVVVGALGSLLWIAHGRSPSAVALAKKTPAPVPAVASASAAGSDSSTCDDRPLALPTGAPPMLSCADARRVVTQVRDRMALPPGHPEPRAFADAVIDWLDPHGLWSAAPDAPNADLIRRDAPQLIDEIERAPRDGGPCAAAREIGASTEHWIDTLRGIYDRANAHAPAESHTLALKSVNEAIFQDDPVTRPARVLARLLGSRVGGFARAFGDVGRQVADAARARLLPQLDAGQWTRVVLAAALRAYVPAVDAHGQWAPLDEEWSLYSADSAVDDGPELWGQMMRTAVGVRVESDPAAPLRVGDLVVQVAGIRTAGLSVEQVEQLSHLEPIADETSRSVAVLRPGQPSELHFDVPYPPASNDAPGSSLKAARVPYGDGSVLVVTLSDVPDELGDDLARLVERANAEGPPEGILLDLRGNGGGSTDGASGAIGVFLPGAPLFPLRHRDGSIEIQRALTPPRAAQWRGPVASLVDGYTASAAEMIAGALDSYQRGSVVGARTFGKGCIQEYFDDRAGAGVLRLTTMLFALPDGAPLQHVGLVPDLLLHEAPADEREASVSASLPAWRGPDVRDHAELGGPAWPPSHGHVGPCSDAAVCRALRRLGMPRSAGRRARAGLSPTPRRALSRAERRHP